MLLLALWPASSSYRSLHNKRGKNGLELARPPTWAIGRALAREGGRSANCSSEKILLSALTVVSSSAEGAPNASGSAISVSFPLLLLKVSIDLISLQDFFDFWEGEEEEAPSSTCPQKVPSSFLAARTSLADHLGSNRIRTRNSTTQ